ncbi:MAG: hypothetical protein PHC71_00775 [Candidatus Omnitrophica bacterium]|nr:hypothetical protein [Candidatus Omnitrophota bacterium]
MKVIYCLSLGLLFLLSGCSSFQLSSERKQEIVDKISPNVITVTFCGNAYMGQKEVEKYALQRASSETLSKGYSYFVVLNKDDKSRICSLVSGVNKNNSYSAPPVNDSGDLAQTEFIEPNITLTIKCIAEGEKIPENAVDAQKYLNDNFPGLAK